eukprot:GILI01005666.1.p1 GENE.GILI01005666.1~~GILI01005666.1.p1  ORF type:complete len:570 (+),score=116.26 GILI01005666.1:57-1766(+)
MPPLPPPPLTSRKIVDNLPPISSEPVSRRESFAGTHHYGALASSLPSSSHTSHASQGAAERPASVTNSHDEYLRVSCAKVYFPNVQATVEFPEEAVAAFNSTARSNNTVTSPSVLSPTAVAAGAFSVAHSQQGLPPSFIAADIENIIQLRSSLGTSAGLLSSTITGGKDHPLSPASHASVGVLPRNAPNALLCGHPLVLYKVRCSAASAFNCFPRFGMLQRHPGDTINYFSASELMAGGVGDSLTAIERASERLSVTIRRREDEEPAPPVPSGPRTRSPSRHPIVTRDVEFLRIEYIVILDTPTQVAIKNALRDKLEAIPITKQDTGSKAAAANLKTLQPTISKLYDELKVKVPIVSSLNGSGVHTTTNSAPDIIQKSDTIAPQPPTLCLCTSSDCYVRGGHVDITCHMDCGGELAEYIPKHQGERFAMWSGIADEDGAKDFTDRSPSADGKPSLAKVQHPIAIHENAVVRLRIRQSREGSIASGQTGSTPQLLGGGKNSPPTWQGSSPKTPQGIAKSYVTTVEPSVSSASNGAKKSSLFGGGCPVGVVVLLVVLLYSFVYAWRHCKEI